MDERVLEGLFRWTQKVEIKDSFGEPYLTKTGVPVVVYQRIVGDAEIALARQTAIRSSAIKRRQLADPNSLDRLTLIPDYSLLEKDNLVGLIILSELQDLRAQASRDLVFPFPEQPSASATLQEQEENQEAIDTFHDRREVRLQEATKELVQMRRNELGAIRIDRLRKEHENAAINSVCREELLAVFNEMITYLATHDDAEYITRSYRTFNEFRNAASHLKRQLIEAYAMLELSGKDLK